MRKMRLRDAEEDAKASSALMSVPFTLHTAFGDRFQFDQPSSKVVLKNDRMIFFHILLLIFSFEAIKISVNAVKLWFVI